MVAEWRSKSKIIMRMKSWNWGLGMVILGLWKASCSLIEGGVKR